MAIESTTGTANSFLNNTQGASESKSSTDTALTKLNEDFDSFLTLLTTQLKNQDPMDPVDTNEFTDQLVQFAEVEQLMKQNEYFESLLSNQDISNNMAAASYVGYRVEVPSTTATLRDGYAQWTYDLPEEAAATTVQVYGSDGQLYRTIAGATDQGEHGVVWDGTDESGNTVEDGAYQLRVSAVDQEGNPIFATVKAMGVVGQVVMDEGGPAVSVNGEVIPVTEITRVGV